MGNCIGNAPPPPQQVYRPNRLNNQNNAHQQWAQNQYRSQQTPVQINQQQRNASKNRHQQHPQHVEPFPPLEDLDSSLEDAYNPLSTKKGKTFHSKELNVNQMALFQKYQGQCHQNTANMINIKVPSNK